MRSIPPAYPTLCSIEAMTLTAPSRRTLVTALGLTALVPSHVLARADRDLAAEAFVQTEGQKALTVINNRALSATARAGAFRQIVDQIADFRRISSFVLGKYARVMTPPQRQRFEVAFRSYAQRLFQTQMASFKGDQLKVTGSAVRAPGDSVVNTLVSGDKSAGPLVVSWRVLGAGAAFKVVDVQTRGFWLAITLQQDFVSTIDNAGGSVEALIQKLEGADGR